MSPSLRRKNHDVSERLEDELLQVCSMASAPRRVLTKRRVCTAASDKGRRWTPFGSEEEDAVDRTTPPLDSADDQRLLRPQRDPIRGLFFPGERAPFGLIRSGTMGFKFGVHLELN